MANLKLICFLLLAILMSLSISATIAMEEETPLNFNHDSQDQSGQLDPSECPKECERRCSKTHHRKPCLFFCNKCCAKCLCVPPGTYGNKEQCPCYNNWKNKRGGPKCP